ncbi:MAG: tetratricopeptide repeat protein [Opitutae bacterium]|nr:tetratricopeptide repeat protein [Opitutae bacterium]
MPRPLRAFLSAGSSFVRRHFFPTLGLAALLVAAVGVAFWPALRGQFIWDDDLHVTANPTIVGPLGLWEIWTTSAANYFPLVLTNFWLQHALWGLNPLPYHVVTLALHAASAVLLWRLLWRLDVPGAWLGAALWALHPVQVESVAWISELKNTQSALFYLLAIRAFVEWIDDDRRRRFYALALLGALLAILSKPSAAMLPLVLALCSWWRRGRLTWHDAAMLAPFFVLSALAAGWTIWEQKFHSGAVGPEWSQSWPERGLIAGRALWFYLGKLVWPHPLIFIYPRWSLDARQLTAYLPLAAALGGLVAAWVFRHRGGRPVFLAVAYFVALLFPVLGFFDVYFFRYSFVGDHFQYLASIGPLALAGAGLARLGAGMPAWWQRARPVAAGVLLLGLATLSWRQCSIYASRETLWRATVNANPDCVMAWLNLADTLVRQNRHAEAVATFEEALRRRPHDADAHNDLGGVLLLLGRPQEALPHLESAIRLRPDFAEGHDNLGNVLRALGRRTEAMAQYTEALRLNPNLASAHNNLGCELAERGQPAEALPHFATALRLKPDHAEAHDNLATALRELGRVPETLPHFVRALELRPAFTAARCRYAAALAAIGRTAEALTQLERAVALAPESAEAHHNLGTALAQSGRVAEAVAQFEAATRLAPDFASARLNLGLALCALQRWPDAIAQLEAAVRLVPDSAAAHSQLAVALVNNGQLPAAVPHFEAALLLAPQAAEVHANYAQVLDALERPRAAAEHRQEAARLLRAQPSR